MRARGTRRFATRLGLAVTLLLVSLAVLVRLASAHHPELTASATCGTSGAVVRWTAVAWQTTESDRRVNHDVRVQAYISGTWQEIGRSSFSAANNYEFTGTYDLPAAVTGTLPLKVTSIVRWGEAENAKRNLIRYARRQDEKPRRQGFWSVYNFDEYELPPEGTLIARPSTPQETSGASGVTEGGQ